MKLDKEAEEKRKLEDMRKQTVQYYENTEIVDFLFASVNHGKSIKPLITGAVLKHT